MLHKGYAAVTYRALAAEAGVTPALVQYYFPALDDLLVATIRRRVSTLDCDLSTGHRLTGLCADPRHHLRLN